MKYFFSLIPVVSWSHTCFMLSEVCRSSSVLVCFSAGEGGAVGGGSYQEENGDCKRQADSALQPQRGMPETNVLIHLPDVH